MFRKCLHILLVLWLINSVVSFHASNPFDNADLTSTVISANNSDNTLLDAVRCYLGSDNSVIKKQNGHNRHKILNRNRYSLNGRNQLSLQLFVQSFISTDTVLLNEFKLFSIPARNVYGVLKPAYYLFLFRLSPF